MASRFLAWPKEKQQKFWKQLPPGDRAAIKSRHHWKFYSRPNQQIPPDDAIPGGWSFWMIDAGRGFGKTRVGAETVRIWVRTNRIVNLAGPTTDDIRKTMVDGQAGSSIMEVCPKNERPIYEPSNRRLVWPNGAVSNLLSAEEPERFRGPQCHKFWADELAAWKYAEEAWDLAMMGLRLGENPQAVITTTPKPTKLIKQILKDPRTFVTRGTTYENRANLSAKFFEHIIAKYEGTRLGRQELNAELLDDNPTALWRRAEIDALRVKKAPPLRRVAIGVDPAVSAKADSDDTGIIGVGVDHQWPPHFYVMDDRTGNYRPREWAEQVVAGAKNLGADRVIGEVNNGGDLVEANLRTVDISIPYRAVHASRGKTARAEPVAALYEQGRVHHVGAMGALEDEMCDWDPSVDPKQQKSPNRMDALVWAIWELAELGKPEPMEGVVEYEEDVTISNSLDEFDLRERFNAL
jgi:phage terminase large subunit-like protein